MQDVLPLLPGFKVNGILGAGATSTVYSVERGGKSYAFKLFSRRNEGDQTSDSVRFMREAATIARLNHPGIVKLHEVGEIEGRAYLLMERIDGDSLSARLQRGPLTLAEFLKVAGQLAKTLDYFHARGVVHKDLKPDNILLGADGGVKIIDFGLAVEMADADRRAGARGEEEVAGTLLYSAPEQSGLLKRPVDGRSDLYALGGVFYHCLTGQTAFGELSAANLMESHLTVKPVAPNERNREVPAVLSAMTLKLLSKDPDDRYQSARGLLHDLRCFEDIASRRALGAPEVDFVIGSGDSAYRVAEVPLIGREGESATIARELDRARRRDGSVLLITGEGGSGKSRLIREAILNKANEDLLILSGKAKQGETVPFGPLREALDHLLAKTQRGLDADRARIRRGLVEAAGDLAAIVRRLSPGLKRLFSEAVEIPPLDGAAEQERFYLTVADFLVSLADFFGPTVLLIDDIQWLDDGSSEILRQMSKKLGTRGLLLAATARSDAESRVALEKFVAAVDSCRITRIDLQPLSASSTADLISAYLGGAKPLDAKGVERISVKANGNPFAVGEYVRILADGGFLVPMEDRWVLDERRLHEIELPGDVIQLLISRIGELRADSVKALSTAALIGFDFEFESLERVSSQSADSLHLALADGVRNALIEKTQDGYSFVHDRVSEALIQGLDVDRRAEIHERIAFDLEKRDLVSPQHLYALARHFYRAFPQRYPKRAYQAHFAAGAHAIENFSNEEGLELLKRALSFGESSDIGTVEKGRVHEFIGTASTRLGRHDDAIASFNTALELAATEFDRAHLFYLMGLARASAGEHEAAKGDMFRALAILGAPFPRSLVHSVLSLIYQWARAEFLVRTKWGYGKAVGSERQRRLLISKINSSINLLGYLLGDEILCMQSVIREVSNVQLLGPCLETAKAHIYYSLLLAFMVLKKASHRHARIATSMARQLGVQETIAYCDLFQAVGAEFLGDLEESRRIMADAYPRVMRYCSAWDKSAAIGHRLHVVVAGKIKENLAFIEKAMPVMRETGDLSMLHAIYTSLHMCHHILGDVAEATRALQAQRSLPEQAARSLIAENFMQIYFIQCCLIQANLGRELEHAINRVEEIGINLYHTRNRYSLIGFARVEQYRRTEDPSERARHLKSVAKYVRKSGVPTALTPLHLSLHFALKGASLTLSQKYSRAKKALARAEELAWRGDNQWALWLIARERARLFAAQGDTEAMRIEAMKALKIAVAGGWRPICQQLRQEFGLTEADEAKASPAAASSSGSVTKSFGRLRTAQRASEALLQINLASRSSIDPADQSRQILDKLIEILGAERAFLFEEDAEGPGALRVRAGRGVGQVDIPELTGFSSTVVSKVGLERRAFVTSGSEERELDAAESVADLNLRSIVAAPILFREKFLGVLYLDSTLAKGLFTEADVEVIAAFASHIGIAVEAARAAKVEIENRLMKKDLEVTLAVQTLILPKMGRTDLGAVKLASYYRAAQQSGGCWWWHEHDAERGVLTVLVGDVSGHGAGAAMLSAAVSGIYHGYRWLRRQEDGMSEFLHLLNASLYEFAEEKYVLSMGAFEISLKTGDLSFWSAGSPPMFIVHGDARSERLSQKGENLGTREANVEVQRLRLSPGDRVGLFTEGIFKVSSGRFEPADFGGIERLLERTKSEALETAASSVVAAMSGETDIEKPHDDVAFVLLDYCG